MPELIKEAQKEHPQQPEVGRRFDCVLCGTQMKVVPNEPIVVPAVVYGRFGSDSRAGWFIPCLGCGQNVFIPKFDK